MKVNFVTKMVKRHGIQDPKTLTQLQVYLLVRDAVLQLRSVKAWTLDASKHMGAVPRPVSLNLTLVRQLFSNLQTPRSTIKQLLIRLHPDHMRTHGTLEEQQPAFRNAFEFLKEVILLAFDTQLDSTGNPVLLDKATTPFTHQFSGDIRPTLILNAQGILKHKNTEPIRDPFLWPDFQPVGSNSGLGKRKEQASPTHESESTNQKQKQDQNSAPPAPDTNTHPPIKRPNQPFPWEYCSKCWEFAEHHTIHCTLPEPKPEPDTFHQQLLQMQKRHRQQRQKQKHKKN